MRYCILCKFAICILMDTLVSGLKAELYYVREGVINEYAMKFVVLVSAQVHKLHFTWENLAGRPVSFENSWLVMLFVRKSILYI